MANSSQHPTNPQILHLVYVSRVNPRTAVFRTASWAANDKKCFYCQAPVTFGELELDHLIPASTPLAELENLKSSFPQLPSNFHLDHQINLVPVHRGCNNRKSNQRFCNSALHFFFEIWAKKQRAFQANVARLQLGLERDKVLSSVARALELKTITAEDLAAILCTIPQAVSKPIPAPLVIDFSIDLLDPSVSDMQYDNEHCCAFWDRLETELLDELARGLTVPVAPTEGSSRNGETLSLRLAFWDVELTEVVQFYEGAWEILEWGYFEDVYSPNEKPLFIAAVNKLYGLNLPIG